MDFIINEIQEMKRNLQKKYKDKLEFIGQEAVRNYETSRKMYSVYS